MSADESSELKPGFDALTSDQWFRSEPQPDPLYAWLDAELALDAPPPFAALAPPPRAASPPPPLSALPHVASPRVSAEPEPAAAAGKRRAASASASADGGKRRRRARGTSCGACYRAHRRCVLSKTGSGSCTLCEERELPCSLVAERGHSAHAAGSVAASAAGSVAASAAASGSSVPPVPASACAIIKSVALGTPLPEDRPTFTALPPEKAGKHYENEEDRVLRSFIGSANEACLKLLGDVRNKPLFEILHIRDKDSLGRFHRHMQYRAPDASSVLFRITRPLIKINNEWRVVKLLGQYFHNDRGTPEKAVFSIDEIGEKVEAPIIPDLSSLRRVVDANKATAMREATMAGMAATGSTASSAANSDNSNQDNAASDTVVQSASMLSH